MRGEGSQNDVSEKASGRLKALLKEIKKTSLKSHSVIIKEKELRAGVLPVNKIICGNTLDVIRKLPDSSVDCVITSPPYYSKRDYGEEACTIWGGDTNCEHEWVETPPPRPRSVNDVKDTSSKQATVRGCAYDAKPGMICSKCGAWYGDRLCFELQNDSKILFDFG